MKTFPNNSPEELPTYVTRRCNESNTQAGENQSEDGASREMEARRKRYLAHLEAQHQADVRQMAYEKQIRQQQVREELEQRRKRYEQQESQKTS